MADKKISFGFFGKDNGVASTLGKVGDAMEDVAKETDKLSAAQLDLREASLNAKKASENLSAAQEKAARISKLSAASDKDKLKAANSVEAAEIKYGKALLQVASAGDKARKSVDDVGDASKRAGTRSTPARRGSRRSVRSSAGA